MVQINDREDKIEFTRMALNMVEIGVDYEGADLILQIIDMLNKKYEKTNMKDIIKLKYEWRKKWTKYYDRLTELKQKKQIQIESKPVEK